MQPLPDSKYLTVKSNIFHASPQVPQFEEREGIDLQERLWQAEQE